MHTEILAEHPRDVLALGVAHSCDYVRGDVSSLHRRVARVLGAWQADLPGYHSVLAMYAFGLEEAGRYGEAEDYARRALEIEPRDVRAHHALVHVYEMLGRAEDGIRWAGERAEYWTGDSAAIACNGDSKTSRIGFADQTDRVRRSRRLGDLRLEQTIVPTAEGHRCAAASQERRGTRPTTTRNRHGPMERGGSAQNQTGFAQCFAGCVPRAQRRICFTRRVPLLTR